MRPSVAFGQSERSSVGISLHSHCLLGLLVFERGMLRNCLAHETSLQLCLSPIEG